MKFWKKNWILNPPLGIARKLRYVVPSNFNFWSVSIRALDQKLRSFEVFSS